MNFIKEFRGSILTGFLVGTSYIPFPPWAVLFCYAPLFLEIYQKRESLKKTFLRAWIAQFILTIIGFPWIAYVSHEFGYMPWPMAALVLLVFSSSVHLHIPLALTLGQFLRSKFSIQGIWFFILLATFLAVGEQIWPATFPWNLGYTLFWAGSPIAQISDTIGFFGISLLLLFSSSAFAWAFHEKSKRQVGIAFGAVAAGFLVLHLLGNLHLKNWNSTKAETGKKLRVLLVQANIGNLERQIAERGEGFQGYIAEQYFDQTRKGLAKNSNVDLIIWPESAFPEYLNPNFMQRKYQMLFSQFMAEIKIPILTGAYSRIESADGKNQDFNASFLYDEKMQNLGFYHKSKLLVFGEYTPLSKQFPFLTKISPAGEGFDRGDGPKVIPFRNYKIGLQICYESLYPEFSRELSKLGAHFLVNLTNDSWFGPSSEPKQHMIMTLARAVETRRPLLRVTNTGFTTAVQADGTILERSPLFAPWSGLFEIEVSDNPPQTFYSRFGAWLVPLELIMIGLILLLGKANRKLNGNVDGRINART